MKICILGQNIGFTVLKRASNEKRLFKRELLSINNKEAGGFNLLKLFVTKTVFTLIQYLFHQNCGLVASQQFGKT